MYMIENFGGWILETRRGGMFFLIVSAMTLMVLWRLFFGDLIVISSKTFECAKPVPDGIHARCTEYREKGRIGG